MPPTVHDNAERIMSTSATHEAMVTLPNDVMMRNDQNDDTRLPPALESSALTVYRSAGLGLYGAVLRYLGMPLEKIALYLNSTQVEGNNQLAQAVRLTFREGALTPYKVVGPASLVAWFLQYSVMGFVFQVCDSALSEVLGVPKMPYGPELMEDPSLYDAAAKETAGGADAARRYTKIVLAPAIAGALESVVANRAEVQRYFGIERFASIEKNLNWNAFGRVCGPAFVSNAGRNFVMSSTSFVITPVLYRNYYPQEKKSNASLFWFGLGMNVFVGNTVAITQQALWGRSLDYSVANDKVRNISYRAVIKEGLSKEGMAAFYTVPKWASRVLMNAPVQGTLPWFYNEVLPLAEGQFLRVARAIYRTAGGVFRSK